MRSEYLFWLASICHVSPAEADRLDIWDFAILTDSVDRHLKG